MSARGHCSFLRPTIGFLPTITGKNDKIVVQKWKVYPHPELGFPTASALQTFNFVALPNLQKTGYRLNWPAAFPVPAGQKF